ncbi:hypothetical protein CEP54_002475 [Fusarium duplospermum]|uniref:F-box domain-containing protein n=1 Tax=Fusarium duplospermum TaxID=1325734 RepID=A0A428QV67_9HYPO|nr:hypothetical protein CEP54_002475 [Fusarium duplospermum]
MENLGSEGGGQPQASSNSADSPPTNDPPLIACPNEILLHLATYLPTDDLLAMGSACRFLHRIIKHFMIGQDIASETGDALFWACKNDHVDLVKYILEKGVSPHTYFCVCGKPGSRETSKARAIHAAKTGWPYFEPSCEHDSSRRHVMYPKNGFEVVEVSALVLATRSNSLAVMQVLLDNGAHVVEKKGVILPGTFMPWNSKLFRHRSALSHVRSLKAAKLLMEADPSAINDPANTRYTPLEVILARNLGHDALKEHELFSIVEFLVSKGAWSRRQHGRSFLRNTTFIGGPLQLSMAIDSEKVFKLVVESDRVGIEDQSGESTEAFLRLLSQSATNLRVGVPMGCQLKDATKYSYLEIFVKAGFPLNEPLVDKIYPLTIALRDGNQQTVKELIRLGADANFTDDINIYPLALNVCKTRSLWVRETSEMGLDTQQISPHLLKACNIDGRSFHEEGFTPLMFATSDMIMPERFKDLIDHGADVSLTGRLFPSSPKMNVLQCILQGFPRDHEQHDITLLKPTQIALGFAAFRHYFVKTSWERRNAKLEELFRHMKYPDDFYTPDGENILKWAIDNLYSHDMKVVVEIATPICGIMRDPNNERASCLNALFSPSRCKDYLEFGTLDLTSQMVDILTAQGLPAVDPIEGNTLLHRISPKYGGEYEYSDDILRTIQNQLLNGRQHRVVPLEVTYQHLLAVDQIYNEQRINNIINIVMTLLKHGADINAKNSAGETPFSLLRVNGLLRHFPTQRDADGSKETEDVVVPTDE